MKDKNFVTEIERMSAEHFGYEYPTDFVSHAQNLENRIENKESPSNIRYAFFKVTMRCNSDCAYCEHAYSKNQGNLTERSLEEISRVIKELAEMGVKACSVSGGEPLTYKGIENIIKAMVSNKIEPILLTNGILLPQKLQKIYDAGQRYIIISIDSFNPEHYKENRGIDFDSLMRAYNY
ncbi:MAG: radical SAM protein, partial [Clostridia bacterium]|nr:radical SAM protein [Clostridia bacterium]